MPKNGYLPAPGGPTRIMRNSLVDFWIGGEADFDLFSSSTILASRRALSDFKYSSSSPEAGAMFVVSSYHHYIASYAFELAIIT